MRWPLARAQDRDRVGMRIMSRSPTASTVATIRFRTFALLKALETLRLGREPDVEGVCSLVGKSPYGHLFEPFTCGYSRSSMDSPELNPHAAVLNSG